MSKPLDVLAIPALKDNYIWAIIAPSEESAVIVDPGEVTPVRHFLLHRGLSLKGILLTHHHADHSQGIEGLLDFYAVPVIGAGKNKVPAISEIVEDGATIQIPDFPISFKAMAIPGHTLDHTAYYTDEALFPGDTLFAAGCGRVFEGTHAQMFASLQKLDALPDQTKIYCGHEYTLNNLRFAETVEPNNTAIPKRMAEVKALRDQDLPSLPSTMAMEKATNPFLRCTVPEVIASAEQYVGHKLNGPVEVFTVLRKWKDNF